MQWYANFYLVVNRVALRDEEDEMSCASSRGDCLHATTTGKVYRYQRQTLPTEQQKYRYRGRSCELFHNIARLKEMTVFCSIYCSICSIYIRVQASDLFRNFNYFHMKN